MCWQINPGVKFTQIMQGGKLMLTEIRVGKKRRLLRQLNSGVNLSCVISFIPNDLGFVAHLVYTSLSILKTNQL